MVTVQEDEADGFAPLAVINTTLRWWWVVVLGMVVGGSLGWIGSLLRPPVYEATGQFSASIDYVATGPLTQFAEDVALNGIGDVITSTMVLERVSRKVQENGIVLAPSDLVSMAIFERKLTTWEIRIRSHDPQTAELVANVWVAEGQAVLLESFQHAVMAQQLDRYMRSLESCLISVSTGEPSSFLCGSYRFEELQIDLSLAGKALSDEKTASQGLFPGLLIGPRSPVVLNPTPVIYGRNQLVLAGSLIGFILSAWLVHSGLFNRVFPR